MGPRHDWEIPGRKVWSVSSGSTMFGRFYQKSKKCGSKPRRRYHSEPGKLAEMRKQGTVGGLMRTPIWGALCRRVSTAAHATFGHRGWTRRGPGGSALHGLCLSREARGSPDLGAAGVCVRSGGRSRREPTRAYVQSRQWGTPAAGAQTRVGLRFPPAAWPA